MAPAKRKRASTRTAASKRSRKGNASSTPGRLPLQDITALVENGTPLAALGTPQPEESEGSEQPEITTQEPDLVASATPLQSSDPEDLAQAIRTLDYDQSKALLHQFGSSHPPLRDAIIRLSTERKALAQKSLPQGEGDIPTFDDEFDVVDKKLYWARVCNAKSITPLTQARRVYKEAQSCAQAIKLFLTKTDGRPAAKINAFCTLVDICVGMARLDNPKLKGVTKESTDKDGHDSLDAIIAFVFDLLTDEERAQLPAQTLRDRRKYEDHLKYTNWRLCEPPCMQRMPEKLNITPRPEMDECWVFPRNKYYDRLTKEQREEEPEIEVVSFMEELKKVYDILCKRSAWWQGYVAQTNAAYDVMWEVNTVVKAIGKRTHRNASYGTKANALCAYMKICMLFMNKEGAIPKYLDAELERQLIWEGSDPLTEAHDRIVNELKKDELQKLLTEPVSMPSNRQLEDIDGAAERREFRRQRGMEVEEPKAEPPILYINYLGHVFFHLGYQIFRDLDCSYWYLNKKLSIHERKVKIAAGEPVSESEEPDSSDEEGEER